MQIRKFSLVGIILLLIGCSGAETASEDSPPTNQNFDKQVENFVKKMLKNYQIGGGIGIGIVKDGEVVLEKAYGYRDRELNLPATSSTPFYIASMTKSFMGTLAVLLHENDEIDLEEPLSSYLPFSLPKDIDVAEKSAIDLFTHTSGIGNSTVSIKTAYTGNFTKNEIKEDLEKFSYPVSQGYQYSNLGYIISSITFEDRLSSSWKSLLQARLFDPLEMSNTSANVSAFTKNEIAKPHTLGRGEISVGQFLKKDDTMHAAGGLLTTVEDMNKWMLFHLQNGPKIVSTEGFDLIHSDEVGFYGKSASFNNYGYGIGWNQADWNEYEVSWHGGGYPGYRSICVLSRDNGLGITVMMNQVTPAMNLLVDFLLGNFLEVPDFKSFIAKREKHISRKWTRYQFVRDSVLEAGNKFYHPERALTQYEGVYLNNELGEAVIKSDSNSLKIFLGNLTFDSNYTGDDEFFFFNDADQMYGSIDFYFHNTDDQASSLDFSGVEYKRINKRNQQ